MRPVDKGESPYQQISEYAQALPYLEKRIGCYCSYCEMSINHVPEVEHKIAKDRGGDKTDWNNLLLGCKYCNARKKTIIGDFLKDRWIWPDEDNTFLAFMYEDGIPKLDEVYLKRKGEVVYKQAKNMFEDLKLYNIPSSPSDKDRRYSSRSNAFYRAKESLVGWGKVKGTTCEEDYRNIICTVATAIGFFSVWMNVFQKEASVCVALINAFKGTALNCFDTNGLAIPRPNGNL